MGIVLGSCRAQLYGPNVNEGYGREGRMPGASEQALSPPEPDPSDKAVADARELYTELENARVANRPVSLKLTQDIDLNQIGTRNLNGTRTCRAGHQTFICVGQGQSVWVCVTLCLWSDIGAKLRGGEAEGFDSLRIFRVRGILPMMPSGPTRRDIARTARLL